MFTPPKYPTRPSNCCRTPLTHKHTMSFISMGDVDLLHPPKELEQRRHKLKRVVQSPNSFFMDVKCPGCFTINTVQT